MKLVDENFKEVSDGIPGEILVKGSSVFSSYWNESKLTEEAFTNGWFKTGDIAEVHDGYYKIIGRSSVDIIKSGGYKISALEIEEVLRQHSEIKECAVVGLPDESYGEIIGAAVIMNNGSMEELENLQTWLSDKLAPYKIPRLIIAVKELSRNTLGKIIRTIIVIVMEEKNK